MSLWDFFILVLERVVFSISLFRVVHYMKIKYISCYTRASLVPKLVKNMPAMQETWVQSLGWEDHLEKEKATHSSILAWRISWTVQSIGSQRVGHDWATFTFLLHNWWSLSLGLRYCKLCLMKILTYDSAAYELLGYMVCKYLAIEDTVNSFIKLLYKFTIPPDMYENTVDSFKCLKSVLWVFKL